MSVRRILGAMTALAILAFAGAAGWVLAAPAAQTGVLQNPGFEDPYVPFEGDTTRMVANGWSAWHVPQREGDEGFRNLKPEYAPASAENPDRILAGENAQAYYSFFATHTGGLYQQVQVVPGSSATFSASIYIWSTRYDDPNRSEDPGRVQVQVGIDPQGGTDGENERIIWSTPLEYYDQYRQVSVSASDLSSQITVFIRTTFDLPQKNTVYVDEAQLVVQQPEQPTLPPTLTPTNTLPPTATQPPTATSAQPTATAIGGFPTPTQEEDTSQPDTGTTVPSLPSPTPAANPDFPAQIIHVVVSGDTVGQLATRYGSTVEAIIAANGLNSEALIYVDQELVIPVPQGQATPVPQPTATPGGILPTATPIGILPTATPIGIVGGESGTGFSTYAVVAGDNLTRIAARFNVNLQTLVQLNGILNPNLIKVGQVLRVPGGQVQVTPVVTVAPQPQPQPQPQTHVVRAGENLYRIALRYGISYPALASLNGILDPNRIYVGQVLTLP